MNTHFLKTAGAVLSLCAVAACSQPKEQPTFKINGTVSDEISDTAYYVYIGDTAFNIDVKVAPVDTIIVKDKKFSYSSTVKEPRLIWLQAIFKSGEVCGAYVDFVLVPGETANLKVCNGYFELDGTPFYQQWHTLDTMSQNFQKKFSAKADSLRALPELSQETVNAFNEEYSLSLDKMRSYVMEHKNEEGTLFYSTMVGMIPVSQLISGMKDEVRNGKFKSFIDMTLAKEEAAKKAEEQAAEALAKTSEGAMFVDFSAEYDGKTQKLSDFVGKGKYVLVDFWASWCGPCRREIPNLIDVYNKYKGSKFEVIGVATWDEPDDTKKAIAELQIPYPQIMNAQEAGSAAYGIRGIPEIILFAPDGKIVKRGLRGSDIETEVKKCLGK
ncbi:MAG: AhpC/TSA family protein [Bacteroidales bacterium]|nr:AhpC/TSA family protein [Bacteroidales bacterium]